jgi:hypothetical protein
MKTIITGLLACFCLSSTTHQKNVRDFHILLDEQIKHTPKQFSVVRQQAHITRNTKNADNHTLFMTYMAADNNLHYFAWSNIKQMAAVGSNQNVTIVVQLNEPGYHKKTQRYLIEKNQAILLNEADVNAGKKFNTGDPQTLIDFCVDTIKKFPANRIVLDLWNHGSGCVDPQKVKTANLHELFQLNPNDMMLELNRNYEFLEKIYGGDFRGICFDDTYRSYLSNEKLAYALKTIHEKTQRTFDIIGLDACMMQMVEFGTIIQPYTTFMVGSQEVEIGTGWNYEDLLSPFRHTQQTPVELAKHIVTCYQRTYSRITHDYTLSAADLTVLPELVNNINHAGELLIECLKSPNAIDVFNMLQTCRNKKYCTCFDEPSYIDLGHFYTNILTYLDQYTMKNNPTIQKLIKTLKDGLTIIDKMIIANVTGRNLKKATGLSIYFPEKHLHPSYLKAPFTTDKWTNLIKTFIMRNQPHIDNLCMDYTQPNRA